MNIQSIEMPGRVGHSPAMDRLALAIDTPGGEVYLPIYESFERDLMALDQKEIALDRIRRRARDTRANTAELLAA